MPGTANTRDSPMADNPPSDEQVLYNAFQGLADVLLPLKQELRERAYDMVGVFFGLPSSNNGGVEVGATRPAGHRSPPPTRIAPREPPSPKDFLLQKQPTTDIERVACLAYYLNHHRGTKHFRAVDVSKLNAEAGRPKFANASSTVNNATQAGYLAPVPGGMKQLAPEGERFVDELPDRAAAKDAFRLRRATRQRHNTGKASAAAKGMAG